MGILKQISFKFGIDKAIFFTILTRLIQAGGGIISIIVIAKYLTRNEQGYYYTFASIIAIQVFFELGLSGIITQYSAHEFAYLQWGDDLDLIGDEMYKSRLSSLLRFCVKWFGIIAIALFFILLAVGYYFFSKYNAKLNIEWQKPWIILCITTSMNLFIDPILAFFDGLGQVKDMAKVRLIQKSINIILLFFFFIMGFKLYSSALASLCAILVNYVQVVFSNRLKLLKVVWRSNSIWQINYYKEIFPFQWRIALSWISGYFIFQLFNPVLFATAGAIVAGQMGMTLQALNGVSSISMSWISTKVPLFSSHVAKGDYKLLDIDFNATVKQMTLVNLILISFLILIVSGLNFFETTLAGRFLPLIMLILLCLVTFFNQYVFSWATYLRCHKQEPFLMLSIVSGILCAFSTIVLGRYFKMPGVVIGYTSITLGITLPWAYQMFKTKRLEWHI